MTGSTNVPAFWEVWLATLPQGVRPTTYTAWSFGSSAALADELGLLTRDGVKTATCTLLGELEADGEPVPVVGEYSVILDGGGRPLCIIQTVEVTIRPFVEVDPAFAYEEGEGDRSLGYWRSAHWRYFTPICRRLGREPSADMPLVCERFRLVYVP